MSHVRPQEFVFVKPLLVPPAAVRDQDSVQMLSAWIAENGLHCSIKVGMWQEHGHDEPRSWGILLADVVRHLANAIQEDRGTPSAETADRIVQALAAEFEEPTSPVVGSFPPGHS